MYTLSVKRDFIARHFLVGGDWGAENELHAHHYTIELQLSGGSLDAHGYLVDIVAVEALLDEIVAGYRDRTLNDLPPFSGPNPSIEHFSRILAQELDRGIRAANITTLTVVIWENDIAWASHRLDRSNG